MITENSNTTKTNLQELVKKGKQKITAYYQSHKKRTIIGGGILILILVSAIALPLLRNSEDSTETQIAKVTVGNLTKTIDVVGSVKAVPSAILSFGTEGIVSEFGVQVGDMVFEDDVLISLKDSSVSSSILQAKSNLLDATHELDQLVSANSLLYEAALALKEAENTYRSKLDMWKYWNFNNTPQNMVDKAVEVYISNENALTRAKDKFNHLTRQAETDDDPALLAASEELQAAQFERDKALRNVNYLLGRTFSFTVQSDYIKYKQADAALLEALNTYERYLYNSDEIAAAQANVQALQNTIDSAKIIAPFNGTITNILVDPGQLVSSGTSALQIDALDNLMIDVFVSEVDIHHVSVGQDATITLDALPNKQYAGVVMQVAQAGDDSSGVVEFSITVKVLNPDADIKPGFTAVASIITDQVENALLVPTMALQSRDGRNVVMLVDSQGNIQPVQVEVGVSANSFSQIFTDSISEGDMVMVFSTSSSTQMYFPGGGFGGMGGLGGSGERQRPQN